MTKNKCPGGDDCIHEVLPVWMSKWLEKNAQIWQSACDPDFPCGGIEISPQKLLKLCELYRKKCHED